jgi:MarR family transcriptional regulator, negative regulator of the multidrug operon emrRAB
MKNRVVSPASPDTQDLRTGYYWPRVREFGKKYKKFNWPSVEILLNFIHTYDVLMVHFSKLMTAYSLSPAVFNVLMILSRSSEKKFKQHDISKLLFVSRANVTGLVNTLVRKGLAKREADQHDRRAWLVRITPKGKALLETYLPHHYAEVYRIFSEFKPSEKKELNQLICKFKSEIQ